MTHCPLNLAPRNDFHCQTPACATYPGRYASWVSVARYLIKDTRISQASEGSGQRWKASPTKGDNQLGLTLIPWVEGVGFC